MNILVISGFWPTRTNPITGIFVLQQVFAYLDLGCKVTVVVPQTIRGLVRARPYHQKARGVDVFSPVMFDVPQRLSTGHAAVRANTTSCANAIIRVIQRHGLVHSFQAIHMHDLRYGALSYPRWASLQDAQAVATLHGVDPVVQNLATQPWFQTICRNIWHKLAFVTVVGSPLKPYAESLGIPADKRVIVHNGSRLPEEWRSAQRSRNCTRVVLSVSNLFALKGIDLNLMALAQIRDKYPAVRWEYRIVGEGSERGPLQGLAEKFDLLDRVHFLGQLDHDATLSQIAACDIFSLPSWGEAFGMVYLEAMGRARPVIGCRGWGAAEIVTHGVDGLLVEPKNIQSLADALEMLLIEPALAQKMGRRAREKAEGFTWERNARQYLELFGASLRQDTKAASRPAIGL